MLLVRTDLRSNGNLAQDSGGKNAWVSCFQVCRLPLQAKQCLQLFWLNFHRSHSSTLRLWEFAKRAKKGLMGDCTDSQVPPNPGTRPPSPSLSSTSSLFGDDRQLVDEFVCCLSTPLIVNILSSYYHRQDYHFHNQYYQKIPLNSGTSPLGQQKDCIIEQLTFHNQCLMWWGKKWKETLYPTRGQLKIA